MSWGVKYRAEIKDYLGDLWKVDILYDGYTGSITTVGSGNPPIEINFLDEGDEVSSGIKAKEWILKWNNVTSFQFLPLFTGTARDYLVKIYKNIVLGLNPGDVLVGSGWVDPDNFSEEFVPPIYPTNIHVNDGLGELKYIYFEPDKTGDFILPAMYFIHKALDSIGLDLPIYVAIDIMFQKQNGDIVDSRIFESMYIDWRIFREEEYTYWNYYDILQHILQSIEGARLFQEAGAWWIDRVGVHKTAQYDVDKYLSTGVYDATIKKTAIIALTSNSVALPVRFGSDAQLTQVPGWKQFKIIQEYGTRPNLTKFYNIFGYFWEDEWESDTELLYWSRARVDIQKGENNSVHFPGLVTGAIPVSEFIQSDPVTISQANLRAIQQSWGVRNASVMMKLTVDYKLVVEDFDADIDYFKLYFGVLIEDSLGDVYTAFNIYVANDIAMMHRNATVAENMIIEVSEPELNKWATFTIDIGKVPNPWINFAEWWKVYVKIMPAWSSLNNGTSEQGLMVSKISCAWYDVLNPDATRTISETVNTKNRKVPADITVKFGETPGIFGTGVVKVGQELSDRFIYMDSLGNPITKFGIESAGIGAGLIDGVMKDSLAHQHSLPLFKLRGSVRDNPDEMDYCSLLQDYDGRNYIPTGMSRNVGYNEVQAEWIQVREPEQGTGGEFNWDFSNDFNIGT